MANTQLDMTPYVYAIEGDIVLWVQQAFENDLLSIGLTHFYVMGFMTATFASFIYPIYFDDRHMADRVSLSLFWVYVLAIPFYLFFNVRVTGDHIPAMETIAYDLTRSEEHTSELQSRRNLVCRLLLEKKNTYKDSSGTTS